MNRDQLADKMAELAKEARRVAEEVRPINAVPSETWVALCGLADDLEQLDRDLFTERTSPRRL